MLVLSFEVLIHDQGKFIVFHYLNTWILIYSALLDTIFGGFVWLDFICFYVGEEIELMFEFCFSLKINIIVKNIGSCFLLNNS